MKTFGSLALCLLLLGCGSLAIPPEPSDDEAAAIVPVVPPLPDSAPLPAPMPAPSPAPEPPLPDPAPAGAETRVVRFGRFGLRRRLIQGAVPSAPLPAAPGAIPADACGVPDGREVASPARFRAGTAGGCRPGFP